MGRSSREIRNILVLMVVAMTAGSFAAAFAGPRFAGFSLGAGRI